MPSRLSKFGRELAVLIATGFGVGRVVSIGQGTIASALVLPVIPWFLHLSFWEQGVIAVVLFGIGVWTSDVAEKTLHTKDDHRIVIDEIACMFVMFAFLPTQHLSIVWLLLALVLNRVLDIGKPFGINRLQRLPGGWGVMVDDLAVGIVGNIILQVCVRFLMR